MGGGLDAQVAPNFGRCPYFVIVDTDTMGSEALPNMAQGAASGAGIQAAQTVISRGVKTVLTGNVGPNAFQVFSSTGVQIITGVSGTVREAVEKFKRGELRAAPVSQQPLYGVPGSGMGYGRGMGRGGGMRGGGMGMGRGRQPGYGYGMGMPQVPPAVPSATPAPMAPSLTREQEIAALSNYLKAMEQQLEQIKKRLDELKRG